MATSTVHGQRWGAADVQQCSLQTLPHAHVQKMECSHRTCATLRRRVVTRGVRCSPCLGCRAGIAPTAARHYRSKTHVCHVKSKVTPGHEPPEPRGRLTCHNVDVAVSTLEMSRSTTKEDAEHNHDKCRRLGCANGESKLVTGYASQEVGRKRRTNVRHQIWLDGCVGNLDVRMQLWTPDRRPQTLRRKAWLLNLW